MVATNIQEKIKKNIALIGAGYWGKNHLRNLAQLGLLHSVWEKSEKITAELKKDFPEVDFIGDEKPIIDNPGIEAVVIAVPAVSHYALAKKFLLAGKDVLVEKPLAMTVQQGEELVAIADEGHRILMVGHILQYHSAVMKLKDLVMNGTLGDVRYIYSSRLNIGKLRTEENVLWSFAPHDISLILMLMGNQPPRKIFAAGGAYVNREVYDTTVTLLEFANGVKAHIFVSWLHPYKEQKLVVVGSKKMAVFDDISEEKLFIYPHEIKLQDGVIPVVHKADYQTVDFIPKQPLREELLHFSQCVADRTTPRTDGREGVRVLEILESAERSLQTGK
jgi:UDP-2-acetamido-3-amino-2,3-dideoxy-glucuronate N-acetyltransferase